MLLQTDIPKSSGRKCTLTGAPIKEGEVFYSALKEEGEDFIRFDYSQDAWTLVMDKFIFFSWWKTKKAPRVEDKNRFRFDAEALYTFFTQLSKNRGILSALSSEIESIKTIEESESTRRAILKHVAALLLIRKRILRLDTILRDEKGREILVVYDKREKIAYEIPAPHASPEELSVAEEDLFRWFDDNR